MKECIAISNQKGGVGKSTTASALGAGLFLKGYKVLYVDLDAQGNLSYSMGATNKALTSLEMLTGTATAKEAIVQTLQGDLIPASPALASADAIVTDTGKEYRPKEALEPVKGDYDYISLDTPPSLGVLTVNALTACNSVIIPAQADIYSLQGIGQLSQTMETVKKYCNPALTIKGILTTRHSSRTVLARDMTQLLEDTARELNTKLYSSRIRECVALKEAQASQQDIYSYSPRSNATADYTAFVEEVLGQ
jgi:chromosome partitioning protein